MSSSYRDEDDSMMAKTGRFMARHPMLTTAGASLLGVVGFLAFRVKIAGPSEYIVKTGILIDDIMITKKTVVLPFQTASTMSITPNTLEINVDAMSAQRIPFRMPSVWTIGPKNDMKSLENYARLLMDKGPNGLNEVMNGVIQGEARVMTANMDLNELFSDRNQFKSTVVEKINQTVEPFGIAVYNANIAELSDLDRDNQFFSNQKKRALEIVNQEARVSVSEAVKDGLIGEKTNQSQARQAVAEAEKNAKLVEFERDREVAESLKTLQVAQAEYTRETQLAQIRAQAAAEESKWNLQMAVEEKRKLQELEKKRADDYTTTMVKAEINITEADGKAKSLKLESDAMLYSKLREAEGILAIRKAEAEGLAALISSAGDVDGLNRYLLIRDKQLPILAEKQAEALRGMQPRVSVWSTGPSSNDPSNPSNGTLSNTITDLFKTGMPLFDGIKHQTGYDFMARLGLKKHHQKEEGSIPNDDVYGGDEYEVYGGENDSKK